MRVFIDSGILLIADDASAAFRATVARDIVRRALRERTGVISTQVLHEYHSIATRFLKLDGAAVRARVGMFLGFEVVTVSPMLILAAIDHHRLEQMSFWDSLALRTAQQAGCDVFYSDAFGAGRTVGSMQIKNPF